MKNVLVFCCVFLLSGCASNYYALGVLAKVEQEGFRTGETYILRHVDKNIDPSTDVTYIECARRVNALLSEKGYILVDDPTEASLFIKLDYINKSEVRSEKSDVPYYRTVHDTYKRRDGSVQFFSRQEVAGYNQVTFETTIYKSSLAIVAHQNTLKGNIPEPGKRLWTVMAVSAGEDSKFHDVFPALMALIREYIGTNTDSLVEYKVDKRTMQKTLK